MATLAGMWTPGRTRLRRGSLALAALALVLTGCTASTDSHVPRASGATSAPSSEPVPTQPPGPRWVVTLGDSYISGEGARWGGNTAGPAGKVDALGPDAYFDAGGSERAPGCHRAEQSIATLDAPGVKGKNFACSGAQVTSDDAGVRFRPGLDFFNDRQGHLGQALSLQRFAADHLVTDVIVSIGGNDFGFGAIASRCVSTFLSTAGGSPRNCKDDPALATVFGADHARQVRAKIAHALGRVVEAMRRAGYASSDYRLLVLTYPSPIPPGGQLRYAEDRRYTVGGCPLFAADATWANDTVLTTINGAVTDAVHSIGAGNVSVLDLSRALVGHRLCERGAHQLQETSLANWRAPGAAGRLEWVNKVYFSFAPWQFQESLHPDYWGMAAERACVMLVLEAEAKPSYRCVGDGSALRHHAPSMRLLG